MNWHARPHSGQSLAGRTSPAPAVLWATVAACALAACGNSPPPEGPGDGDCAIDIMLSGAINDHVSGPQYCAASGRYNSPAPQAKTWMESPHGWIGIELYDISEGQVGTFQATLSISKNGAGAGGWATAVAGCEIAISEWRLIDDNFQDFWEYRYFGTGTCSASAKPFGKQTGEITLSEFTIKNWFLWSH